MAGRNDSYRRTDRNPYTSWGADDCCPAASVATCRGRRARLRESEERYALAMEGANEGHWDWDMVNDRLFLSPKMKMLTGLSADRVINTRSAWMAAIVIHPDDAPRAGAALQEHFAGRTPRYDVRVPRPTRGRLLGVGCAARGRCLRDAAGEPYRFVGSASDITAQKQAQLEKEHLEAQLRQSQKMEAIGTLAGGIAHDFNNILGAILGYGELAQQQSAPGSPDATLYGQRDARGRAGQGTGRPHSGIQPQRTRRAGADERAVGYRGDARAARRRRSRAESASRNGSKPAMRR